MKTQSEAKAEHVNYLLPPLTLSFTVRQAVHTRCYLDVRVYSGSHCFLHRELEIFYDALEEIPVIVVDSQVRWLLWMQRFEKARRQVARGEQRSVPFEFPDWPSPIPPRSHTLAEDF